MKIIYDNFGLIFLEILYLIYFERFIYMLIDGFYFINIIYDINDMKLKKKIMILNRILGNYVIC